MGVKNPTLISFVAYTLIEMFNNIEKIDDNLLRRVLPTILEGLEASEEVDYQSAMQMLATLISRKTGLESVVVNALLESLSKGAVDDNLYNCILVAVSVCQAQSVDTFPVSAMSRFVALR